MEDERTQEELRRRHRMGDKSVQISFGLAPELIRQGYLIRESYSAKLHIHRFVGEHVQGEMCYDSGKVQDPKHRTRHVNHVNDLCHFILPNLVHLCGLCLRRRKWPTWEDASVIEMEPTRRVYTCNEHPKYPKPGKGFYRHKRKDYCATCGDKIRGSLANHIQLFELGRREYPPS